MKLLVENSLSFKVVTKLIAVIFLLKNCEELLHSSYFGKKIAVLVTNIRKFNISLISHVVSPRLAKQMVEWSSCKNSYFYL